MKKLEVLIEEIKAKYKEIKKINLSEQSELKSIPSELEYCENLESLNIGFTSISMIPDFVFKLPKLKHITYLGCSNLIAHPAGFKYAQQLKTAEIYIPNGHLEIPEDIYELTNIKSLTVQGNIEEWGGRVCNIKNLEELNSFDSKIRDLPDNIERLTRLKRVSFWQSLFSDNDPIIFLDLDSIFSKLSKCKSLKTLELNRNGLKEIPENIGHLKSLQKLSASENMLTEFQRSIYELTGLKELDLGVNQIYEIPKGIGNLVNLKTLKLNSNWKNKLNTENLFAEIDKLVNLEHIELWSCQSHINITKNITNLKKLKLFDANNNSICMSQEAYDFLSSIKKYRC